MKKKYLILIAICLAFISLDQWTKLMVHTQFALGEEKEVIKNFFHLTYVRNYGAAFGILRDFNETMRSIFFLGITPLVMVVIFVLLKKSDDNDTVNIVALSSVFAGAIGNYIDRLRFGYVIDFLDFFIPTHAFGNWPEFNLHWPAFNVADMNIVCGVIVLVAMEWFKKDQKV